ncbi:MAG: myxosortase MrtP [Pseudomonadota bacterium]
MTPLLTPRSARSLLTEVAVVILGVEAVTLAVTLLPLAWPAAGPYQGVVIALAFLYAPVFADRWAGERPAPAPRGAAMKSLGVGLLVAALVLPLFAAGNHLFQRHVLGREFLDGDRIMRLKSWPAEWEGRPSALDGDLPRVWVAEGFLAVLNPPGGPAVARVDWSSGPGAPPPRLARMVDGALRDTLGVSHGPMDLSPGEALMFDPRGVDRLSVEGAGEVLAGATSARREAPRDQRPGWAWWFWILASQVILIALPEEIFYRGYLQPRLRRVWPGGLRILGVRLGPAILLTSVLFAVGHVVTIPAAFRLAVFFPSLLFCWLRDRTDHVAGPVALHVLSNLAMLTVMRFYG